MKKDNNLELPFQSSDDIDSRNVALSLIDIPVEYESKDSLVEDDALRKSIRKYGVLQSVVLLRNDKRFTVVKGARRVRIAGLEALKSIPALVNEVPTGVDAKGYRDRLRMILTQARQDLLPSQRADLIKQIMGRFGMTQTAVAEMLGVDAGSITNWLSVTRYIPDVVNALDRKEITMHAARAFDGMTPQGQEKVWKAKHKEISTLSAGRSHRLIRESYSPKANPEMYVSPATTIEKMSRPKGKRATKARPRLTRAEKDMLSRDLNLREVELQEAQEELAKLKREITLATTPIRAILRNDVLVSIIPKEMKIEMDRFAEVYC